MFDRRHGFNLENIIFVKNGFFSTSPVWEIAKLLTKNLRSN
jgi:hypothetical protein